MSFQNEQEEFWSGEFGSSYTQRNNSPKLLASNIRLFGEVLRSCRGVENVFEVGANRGINLSAIKTLLPSVKCSGLEINHDAVEELKSVIDEKNIYHGSVLDFNPPRKYDLVLIKGVLIHLNPNCLTTVYAKLEQLTKKYLIIAEYYNPTAVELDYRGHQGKLFKRDFAGEFLKAHNNFNLRDYGFVYRGDVNFPLDDITWFLLERES